MLNIKQTKWRINLSFVAIISLLTLAPSHAQELEEIQVTASRGAQNSSEVVSAVSVIDQDVFTQNQPTIITDALQGAPGVFIQQTTPGQGTAIVRGLKGSEILHLVDGMRLNNALFRNAPNQYLALIDPWIVERSEVVRGPLSSLYGSDAMGGVVQLITKRPQFDGEDLSRQVALRLVSDSATSGTTFNGSVVLGNDHFSSGFAASYQDVGDLRAADRRVQAPTAFKAKAASFFTKYIDQAEREWDVSVQFLEQPETPRYDELVPGFGQTEAASEQFFFTPNSRLFVHGVHRSSGYGKWLDKFEAHLGFQQMTDGRRTQDLGSDRIRFEDNRSDLFGLTLNGGSEPLGRHSLSYGIDFYYDQVSSEREQLTTTTNQLESIRARFPDGSTLRTIDAYVHDQFVLSPRTQLEGGLRLSNASVKLAQTDSNLAADINNSDVSGSVGLLYSLTDTWAGVANLARGFRSPNIFDLGTLGARPGNRFNIANTDLQPETVVTGELGVRYSDSDRSLEFIVWGSDYQDKIISVFTGQTDLSGRDIVQSQNASTVSLFGAEFATDLRINDANQIKLSISYTRGETELENGVEEPADRIPPLNGRLEWRYAKDQWWFSSELLFAQHQDRLNSRDVRDPRINPAGTAGWGSLNLTWGIEASENWRVVTRIQNMFDRAYRHHGSGFDAAGQNIKLSIEGSF